LLICYLKGVATSEVRAERSEKDSNTHFIMARLNAKGNRPSAGTRSIASIILATLFVVSISKNKHSGHAFSRHAAFRRSSELGQMGTSLFRPKQMPSRDRAGSDTSLEMIIPDAAISAANSFMVATIDADIANISNDEFKTVFAGGIVVMCAGVLSAVMVGILLEAGGGNTYDKLVLDTYLNDDNVMEDFLKTLDTDEEREKAREMIANMRSRGLSEVSGDGKPLSVREAFAEASGTPGDDAQKSSLPELQKDGKEKSLFSDYED
jgi:hypothetical protein